MDSPRVTVASAARIAASPIAILRRGVGGNLATLEIVLGGFGLVAALLTAALLSPALGALPGAAGDFAPVGTAVLLAPVGIGVALSRRQEVERILRSFSTRSQSNNGHLNTMTPSEQSDEPIGAVIVDTSAIIDGRLADIITSGFLLADLLIPRFVLDELRRVADSSDPLKRQRGRHGLEMLARIQTDAYVRTIIIEDQFPEVSDVDAKVLNLARTRGAGLLTNDFNLNRVAGVEDVRVLNLNALAQAVRTNALPGETLQVDIHQEGKERLQGIGFLRDGTMIVVEEARSLIGQTITVKITRVIQTQAGRMLFAELLQSTSAGTKPISTVNPSSST